ncbi:CDP-alcohol phosphatidyltransferase family protein [Oscillatoria sp. CS-180]|uniref:CDP-alcohol phosphatidyltransferase family protein n=1 Tax=Oscillatoria sp. CS-180 TaxID=3021720 RepID=UPI002330AD7D|nr:CDP-alcohol phosphatidyltransferase family protein [Oscillatoria sp. CS-180]MDB9524859.1 CDP-alcohol phosphatidyltransferase family protein [Oscillatoria sp. CS-180]
MLTLYHAKPAFQKCVRPLVNQLARWHITPNQITVSAIVLSAFNGLAIALLPTASGPLLCVPLILLGRMALNAIDGMLAREHNLMTSLGRLLNELGDVLSDVVLYLPFCLIPGVSGFGVISVVILAVLTEFAGILGPTVLAKRSYSGPMGKSDRAFVFAALGLLLGLGISPGAWLTGIWGVVCLLEVCTIVNRCRAALKEVPQ